VQRGSRTGVGGRKFADLGHVEGGVRGIFGNLAVGFGLSAVVFTFSPSTGLLRRKRVAGRDGASADS
jgi:hypothetical protein